MYMPFCCTHKTPPLPPTNLTFHYRFQTTNVCPQQNIFTFLQKILQFHKCNNNYIVSLFNLLNYYLCLISITVWPLILLIVFCFNYLISVSCWVVFINLVDIVACQHTASWLVIVSCDRTNFDPLQTF